jgi:hypothetical protein
VTRHASFCNPFRACVVLHFTVNSGIEAAESYANAAAIFGGIVEPESAASSINGSSTVPQTPSRPSNDGGAVRLSEINMRGNSNDDIEELIEKAHDFDGVRKSVEDAASVSGALWFSYLFALFYFCIAAAGVTHTDLLLDSPVKLPFLNVELPLIAFFILAPILFLVLHTYSLMHFVLLAAKVGTFNAELEKRFPNQQGSSSKMSALTESPGCGRPGSHSDDSCPATFSSSFSAVLGTFVPAALACC